MAFINLSSLRLNNESVFAELKSKKIYTDAKEGYTVRYPHSWQIERDSRGDVIFENPDDMQESLTVAAASLDTEGIIRHSISIKSEKDIAKDNLQIALIKAGSAKDGPDLDVALIKTDKKFFYISGHSKIIETFARNFKVQ